MSAEKPIPKGSWMGSLDMSLRELLTSMVDRHADHVVIPFEGTTWEVHITLFEDPREAQAHTAYIHQLVPGRN